MRTSSLTGTLFASLLIATALTPAGAADMTFERSLNVAKEPQNWLLHHGNYEGHRFSALNEINTDTAKNLKVAFTVALGGFEGAGSRYKFGNLEATPLVEDGIMYVPDGWGSVYAIDVTSGKKGVFRWKFDPVRVAVLLNPANVSAPEATSPFPPSCVASFALAVFVLIPLRRGACGS